MGTYNNIDGTGKLTTFHQKHKTILCSLSIVYLLGMLNYIDEKSAFNANFLLKTCSVDLLFGSKIIQINIRDDSIEAIIKQLCGEVTEVIVIITFV